MKLKILFMGTPDFAVFSLDALHRAGEEIVGVVTQPDKPQGRGYTLTPPPVKVWANGHGIPVYQPNSLRTEEFAELLDKVAPDMIVVAAYGKILPKNVIDYSRYGCINVHGSYLPKYRGAAPMQRAIIDGEKQTGVTIMLMDIGLDTGAMLSRKRIRITDEDNFETMHDKIGLLGAELLVETVRSLKKGEIKATKQYGAYSSYAAKIEKSECKIDFSRPTRQLFDLIRGLSPIPLAFTRTPDGRLLKIVEARISEMPFKGEKPGTVVSIENGAVTVACSDGYLDLTLLLPEGKRRMPAADFIRGRGVAVGDMLLP